MRQHEDQHRQIVIKIEDLDMEDEGGASVTDIWGYDFITPPPALSREELEAAMRKVRKAVEEIMRDAYEHHIDTWKRELAGADLAPQEMYDAANGDTHKRIIVSLYLAKKRS